MNASSNFYSFIKQKEGLVLHPYLDTAGVATIGYGSTMYDNGKRVRMSDPPIMQSYAQQLLEWEVKNKSSVIIGLLGNVKLNTNQFDAILSLVYNIGVGGFERSTLLKKIRVNPFDTLIRNEFMKWNKIHKKGNLMIDNGLTARRKHEADLYFSKTI